MSYKLDYSKKKVPKNYTCKKCEAHGVKLYRQYSVFLDHIDLLCTECVLKDNEFSEFSTVHNIGGLVSAVPTEDNSTFWGYTSVPEEGVKWWDNLPISTTQIEIERGFRRGYKVGFKEASAHYNPDVGIGSEPSEDKAWDKFLKKFLKEYLNTLKQRG